MACDDRPRLQYERYHHPEFRLHAEDLRSDCASRDMDLHSKEETKHGSTCLASLPPSPKERFEIDVVSMMSCARRKGLVEDHEIPKERLKVRQLERD